MKNLIIFAHPNHKSLNYSMLKEVTTGLDRSKQVYDIVDLYAEKFDPVLYYDENNRRRDMHLNNDIQAYQEKIRWADRIIMIYPIFWGRPPAMLLGFIDRLFASNFAFRDTGKLLPEGLLKGKEAIVISTMKGPTHYIRLLLNNAHQVLMKRALFNYVGIKKVKFFEFGSLEGNSSRNNRLRQKALKKVNAYFASR